VSKAAAHIPQMTRDKNVISNLFGLFSLFANSIVVLQIYAMKYRSIKITFEMNWVIITASDTLPVTAFAKFSNITKQFPRKRRCLLGLHFGIFSCIIRKRTTVPLKRNFGTELLNIIYVNFTQKRVTWPLHVSSTLHRYQFTWSLSLWGKQRHCRLHDELLYEVHIQLLRHAYRLLKNC
jgi:hypothetical protein